MFGVIRLSVGWVSVGCQQVGCQWVVPILRCCYLLGKVGFVGWSVEKIG